MIKVIIKLNQKGKNKAKNKGNNKNNNKDNNKGINKGINKGYNKVNNKGNFNLSAKEDMSFTQITRKFRFCTRLKKTTENFNATYTRRKT